MLFKTEAIVDAVVDAFQGAAACITPLPGGTAMRCRDEDTPILLRDVDADNASIVARIYLTDCVALGLTLAVQARLCQNVKSPIPVEIINRLLFKLHYKVRVIINSSPYFSKQME